MKKIFINIVTLLSLLAVFNVVEPLLAADITNTKHNLSLSGPGTVKSTTEEEICIFCHTPHHASRTTPFLWNRTDTTTNYTTYTSSTLLAAIGQPSGSSKMCLSCHDGTIALGSVLSRANDIPFSSSNRFMPTGNTRLGIDLSNDHPVSFIFDESLAVSNGELVSPPLLPPEIILQPPGIVQCTSCHNPHDNSNGKFLVTSNQYARLCTSCHDRTDWASSAHATSTATWNGSGSDPWPDTVYSTVTENACVNCHQPHNAAGSERLLHSAIEEDNCIVCHNGNVASTDIEAVLFKNTGHRVQDFSGIHDAAENVGVAFTRHVECVDCHNPHRVSDNSASAPTVPGRLRGVSGVSIAGTAVEEATNLYEICFKCHADNNVVSSPEIRRLHSQLNTRLEFNQSNPSFHPVAGPGRNSNVPSLISPLNENSIVYCTDCHNNDASPAAGGSGPSGPHGSANEHILERNYNTVDRTTETAFEYALCYKCHDRNSIMSNASGFPHSRHVGPGMMGGGMGGMGGNTPCSTCHDAHGVSSFQGNDINNAHLINFNLDVVSTNASGLRYYETLGTFQGRCYLNCHGMEHNPRTYPGMMGGGGMGGAGP